MRVKRDPAPNQAFVYVLLAVRRCEYEFTHAAEVVPNPNALATFHQGFFGDQDIFCIYFSFSSLSL
jgi:hypothetical protein